MPGEKGNHGPNGPEGEEYTARWQSNTVGKGGTGQFVNSSKGKGAGIDKFGNSYYVNGQGNTDGVSNAWDSEYAGKYRGYENPNSLDNRRRERIMQLADEGRDFAGSALERARSGDTAAQHQMQAGLGSAQQAMRQQSVGRGANPLGQRAAMYSGGQMMQRGVGQSATLRAQEMKAAEGMYADAMKQRVGAEQNSQMMAQQQAGHALQREGFEAARAAEEWEQMATIAGGAMGAAGGAIGEISSENAKTDKKELGTSDAADVARQFTPETGKVDEGEEEKEKDGDRFGKSIGGGVAAAGRMLAGRKRTPWTYQPQAAMSAPQLSDKHAKQEARELGRSEGMSLARELADAGRGVEEAGAWQEAPPASAGVGGGATYTGPGPQSQPGGYASGNGGGERASGSYAAAKSTPMAPMAARIGDAFIGRKGSPFGDAQRYLVDAAHGQGVAARTYDGAPSLKQEARNARASRGEWPALEQSFADSDAAKTARGLDLNSYRYTPEGREAGGRPGPQLGVMAQDVEDTPLGADVVSRGPSGFKQIDVQKAAGLSLGLIGSLQKQLDELRDRGPSGTSRNPGPPRGGS